MPIANDLITLFTQYPCAGDDRGHDAFQLKLPRDLSATAYDAVVKNVEFRRKCMNQGFDNLLELLQIHREAQIRLDDAVDTALKVAPAEAVGSES